MRIVLPATAAALTLLAPGPRLSSASEDAAPGHAVLTRIRDIRALTGAAEKGHAVRIRGTVTYLDERWPSGLIVHDGDMGQFVLYTGPQLEGPPHVGLRVGDRVEVLGRTKPGGFAPNVDPSRVRRLGRGPLPRAARLSYSALLTGKHDCEYV